MRVKTTSQTPRAHTAIIVDVTTPYGDRYRVNCDTGRLTYIRRDGPTTVGSAQWRIVGVSSCNNFAFGRLLPGGLAALVALADGRQLRAKRSGNPLYTLCDLDHGTRRTHGNTKYHGIATVTRVR